ncbi:hypothetical protein [Streptomyces sp. NRRL S-87]|uniref:hypothetical protein n=1 Tax=Streptomyces sp. NRRL S-87 TaxID=1463920 RepID=UPI000B2DE648|nr:hypothetical protein [Streptomyces sp. NRRL S-87]
MTQTTDPDPDPGTAVHLAGAVKSCGPLRAVAGRTLLFGTYAVLSYRRSSRKV